MSEQDAIKRGEYLYRQLGLYCAVLFAPDERLEEAERRAADYKERYEYQYEMKCKAEDERDALTA